ncbi:MAG: MFS transporter [Dehalococcoidia bacterium]|nr:MFS transporter [Dehalococcoidia bacterium]MSQ34682.1 MFS transporter [Dehalococcoidia bacterium]
MTTASLRRGIFYGWFIVGTTFFMAFLAVGTRNGFGLFFKPWQEEFGWSVSQISLVAAIGTVVNGVTQPFLGKLYDRFGAKPIILVSLTALGAGTIVLSFVNQLWQLYVVYALVLSAAAGGASFVTTGPLIAKWFKRKRGTAMSITSAGASAGGLIMVPFAAYLMLLTDWRVTWGVLGGMTLLIGLPLVLLVLRETPGVMGLEADGGPGGSDERSRKAAIPRCPGPLECDNWREAFSSWPIWLLLLAYFVCGVTTTALAIHFVPIATARGLEPGPAALAFGVMMGVNIIGVLGAGWISDRTGRKDLLALVYAVRGVAYALMLFLPSAGALWLFAPIAGLSWIATVPLTYSLTAEIYGLKNMGTLSGVVTMSHQLGGAAAIFIAGWAFDRYGSYTVFWAAGASLLAVASVLAFLVRERALSARYQPPLPTAQPAVAPSGGAGS